jgi:translation initiation factor 4B
VARDPPRRTFSGVSSNAGSEDRDWSSARGAKFTPSSRESSGYGRAREHEPAGPTAADEAGQWRSARPLVEAQPERRGPGARDAPPHRPSGPADTESTWSRGTRVPAAPAPPAEPTRQRLKLAPRSSAPSGANSPEATPAKANPFGAARPVDTHTRELEAEQHAEQRRREAAAAKAKPAPAPAKKEEERRPVRVHPSRMPPKEAAAQDEDGFEAVGPRGGKAAAADEAKPAAKPATTKQGFSFAAAAGKVDVDVDDVADKVADVSV